MLASGLLLDFLNRFYGYASWDAELWFVGMEEGGGNSEEESAKRLEAWDRADDLADIRDYHYESRGSCGRPLSRSISASNVLHRSASVGVAVRQCDIGWQQNSRGVGGYASI